LNKNTFLEICDACTGQEQKEAKGRLRKATKSSKAPDEGWAKPMIFGYKYLTLPRVYPREGSILARFKGEAKTICPSSKPLPICVDIRNMSAN